MNRAIVYELFIAKNFYIFREKIFLKIQAKYNKMQIHTKTYIYIYSSYALKVFSQISLPGNTPNHRGSIDQVFRYETLLFDRHELCVQ